MSGVSDEERMARVVLSRAGEPGSLTLAGWLDRTDPVTLCDRLRALRDDAETTPFLGRLRGCDPEAELSRARALGIRFVVPGDPEWPRQLADLAHIQPLHERGGPPVGLWVRGEQSLDQLVEESVAVVGARAASQYGADVARSLASTMADAGYTVVSGAAFGIDQAAHRGALARRRPTVAMLACGVDRAYPEAHRELLEHIARHGAVVSEAPPGAAPMRIRFLARNRLIAGVARGTVVVEAAIRSGALNTASWTDLLGRPVMGVPGPVTSRESAGVHELIRSRGALLVTRGEDVLEAIGPAGSFLLSVPREPARPHDALSAADREVLDAVPVVQAVSAESIARTAGISPDSARAALERMLAVGVVVESAGRWRRSELQRAAT